MEETCMNCPCLITAPTRSSAKGLEFPQYLLIILLTAILSAFFTSLAITGFPFTFAVSRFPNFALRAMFSFLTAGPSMSLTLSIPWFPPEFPLAASSMISLLRCFLMSWFGKRVFDAPEDILIRSGRPFNDRMVPARGASSANKACTSFLNFRS